MSQKLLKKYVGTLEFSNTKTTLPAGNCLMEVCSVDCNRS